MRIGLVTGFLLAGAVTAASMTAAWAADCQNDTIQGLIRPEENVVPAYQIITRRHLTFKLLGLDAAKAAAWREADPVTLCAAARQSGLFKITNRRLHKQLDAELTPPPLSPFMGIQTGR